MTEIIARRLVMFIENDTIGDGYWNPTIVKSLREYANLVEKGKAGHTSPEVYESPNGNKITTISGTWLGELLPYEGPPPEPW
jgi:hypothetical protein